MGRNGRHNLDFTREAKCIPNVNLEATFNHTAASVG